MITFTAICLGVLSFCMATADLRGFTSAGIVGYHALAILPALVGAAMIYGAYR